MKDYDILVIGSGAGAFIVEQGLAHGLKVAYVDKGPVGGTCLNGGCIPSKIVIYPADRIVEIQQAAKLRGLQGGHALRVGGLLAHEREVVPDGPREQLDGLGNQPHPGAKQVVVDLGRVHALDHRAEAVPRG